jgi:transcriptional regulator with XRE-family HTH domain
VRQVDAQDELVMNTVGTRLRHVRDQRGLTLEQLAERAKLSKSFLWEVEQDRSGISGDRLLRVANVLGASVDFLLRGDPSPAVAPSPVVEIPRELSDLAEELGLTYRQTLALLEVNQSIVARRSSKRRVMMAKEDWLKLYEGVKDFLEKS